MEEFNINTLFPNAELLEIETLKNRMNSMTSDEKKKFIILYQSKRKDPQTILITTLLGLVVVAGIQRFILGQIGMGILYLFTFGFCWIGTIIDLVNYKKMTWDHNIKMIAEAEASSGML